jgi:phospholipid/cholesterol/gamma-HCH transport system substrate-binding protein
MAQRERSQFKAGLFIIISVLLIFGVIIAIKGVKAVFEPVEERHVRFSLSDDIGGLRIGDEVRIGGFKVGVVRRIDLEGLDKGSQASLRVTFSVPQQYPLYQNAHIAIQTTVTGTSVLNIDDIGSGTLLADSMELKGNPSALTALEASLAGAGPDVMSIIRSVKNDTLPKINLAAGKASGSLDSITQAGDTIGSYLSDTKPDFRGTMRNLNSITTDANAKLPGILDHADAFINNVSTALNNASGTLEDLKATLANTKDITGSAKEIIVTNRSRIDRIIQSLKATGDNLKGTTDDLRRSPWRILYHPGPGEMDNLELYDAARQFADGANNINDASLALRDAMNNPGADKAQLQKAMDQLNASFSNFTAVEEKLWKSVRQQ